LKDFTATVTFPLREEFYPTIDVNTGLPVTEPHDPDTEFPIDRHHEIDLREAIRQNLVLELPIRTLSPAASAAPSPHSAKDLNEAPSPCPTHQPDERFSPLRQLLEQQEASEA